MFHLSSLTAAILFHHQSSPQSFTESCQGPGPRRNHERSPPPLLLTPQQQDAAGQQNHHSPMDSPHSIASTSQYDPSAFILPQAAFRNLQPRLGRKYHRVNITCSCRLVSLLVCVPEPSVGGADAPGRLGATSLQRALAPGHAGRALQQCLCGHTAFGSLGLGADMEVSS